MKNEYYVNNKKVNYSIFSAYLKQATRHLVLTEYKNLTINSYEFNKQVEYEYFDFYNEMKNNGVIYTIDKIDFKVLTRRVD